MKTDDEPLDICTDKVYHMYTFEARGFDGEDAISDAEIIRKQLTGK